MESKTGCLPLVLAIIFGIGAALVFMPVTAERVDVGPPIAVETPSASSAP
jgi:hypothetical protein